MLLSGYCQDHNDNGWNVGPLVPNIYLTTVSGLSRSHQGRNATLSLVVNGQDLYGLYPTLHMGTTQDN